MKNYGSNIPGVGFLPNVPGAEDVLAGILQGTGEGYSSMFQSPAALALSDTQKKAQELKRSYAQFAASPAGEKILEDLLDQSLRRGVKHPDTGAGIEQEALYGRERHGQNAMIIYILSMIEAGRNLKSEKSTKKKAK